MYGLFKFFIGIPLFFIIPIYTSVQFDLSTIAMILMMIPSFALVYFIMVGIEKGILNLYKTRSEKEEAIKEPLVKEFIRMGWSIDRPSA